MPYHTVLSRFPIYQGLYSCYRYKLWFERTAPRQNKDGQITDRLFFSVDYESLRKSTKIYKSLQKSTEIYKSLQKSTKVYKNLQKSTEIYKNLQKSTKIYKTPGLQCHFSNIHTWNHIWP